MRRTKKEILTQFFYNLLVSKHKNWQKKWWTKLWNELVLKNVTHPVYTTIHGKRFLVNAGYTYPLYSRLFPQLNNPLLELAFQTWKEKKRQISLIDIGAAVGDTICLIESNIPDVLSRSFCIEGDVEFFSYLKTNLGNYDHIECINVLLSDKNDKIKDLVRIHAGTASAQGVDFRNAKTLDTVMSEIGISQLDLFKIDVDGFDGKVLAGSKKLIKEFQPNIIFEWHPILYKKTNNDVCLPFVLLKDLGYRKFLFFTKYGIFSHFMVEFCNSCIDNLSTLCENNYHDKDWHYDVVAIPDSSSINMVELAECSYAKAKINPF